MLFDLGMKSLPGLPQSLHEGELSACGPTSLEAAESCLIDALSKEDLEKLLDQRTAAFRGALDCALEIEWRLADPNAPMAKVMKEKIGVEHPTMAAGSIIQDIQLRAAGSAMNWERAQQAAASIPLNEHPTTCPSSIKSERGNGN